MLAQIIPQDLTEGKLQLHYAIQLIAATGAALAKPQPDYSHTSLGWDGDLHLFVGATIPADQPFRVAIDPVTLTALLLAQNGSKLAQFPLAQKTLAEGLAWLKGEISWLGVNSDKVALLSYPPDDFPDHPIAHGAPFSSDQSEARQKLGHYYGSTALLLQEIVATTEGASPIHIWPHHFDMATLVSRPGTQNGEPISIGIGFSPGDASYSEPYWYVSPYPYPDPASLSPLVGNGFWHVSHWVGAVLTASQLQQGSTEPAQIKAFLTSALKASQALYPFRQ